MMIGASRKTQGRDATPIDFVLWAIIACIMTPPPCRFGRFSRKGDADTAFMCRLIMSLYSCERQPETGPRLLCG